MGTVLLTTKVVNRTVPMTILLLIKYISCAYIIYISVT